MKRAVIYARYSSDSQREESIDGQIRECTEYAKKNDLSIVTVYVDRAYSARTDNRPDFQRMIKDSEKGLFDIILVWKLDRFARDRYDSAHYKHLLKKNNVKVVSATEPISDTPEGQLLETMLEGMAAYYSAELCVKVVRGMTENALKCKYNGGTIPFGYIINSDKYFEVDTAVSNVVQDVFTKYLNGSTMQELADELNSKGLRRRGGKKFTIQSISHMLRNRRYIGEYKFREIIIPNGIPQIVPEELFENVQHRIQSANKIPARHKAEDDYLLVSKLFCGKCGSVMIGESGKSHTGSIYRYYKCANAKKRKSCSKKPVRKQWIEDIVITQLIEILLNDTVVEKLADTVMELQKKENIMLPILRKQLADVQRNIDNILNAIMQGILSPSVQEKLKQLENTKQELEVSILQAELERPSLSREQIIFWIQRNRNIDLTNKEQRQRLIDRFINRVYLYDNKIVITFNYKENAEQITRPDIEIALGSDLCKCGAPEKTPHLSTTSVGSFQ